MSEKCYSGKKVHQSCLTQYENFQKQEILEDIYVKDDSRNLVTMKPRKISCGYDRNVTQFAMSLSLGTKSDAEKHEFMKKRFGLERNTFKKLVNI